MNLVLILVASLVLPQVRSTTSFKCPALALIYPCTCTKGARDMVSCINVGHMGIVQGALDGRFSGPLPALLISNVSSLPPHSLGDIRVKRLTLRDSPKLRIDDDAFDGQDSLKQLSLTNVHLRNIPTEALKRLPGLQTLNLNDNYISKIRINSFDVESRIRVLHLHNNRVSTIERNAFPRSLRSLYLGDNRLSTLNGSLLPLRSLEILHAEDNKLSSVKGQLRGLRRLNFLDLRRNGIASLKGVLVDLISLIDLNLGNNLLQNLEDLYTLTNLRRLKVYKNRIVNLGPDIFMSLSGITHLDLSGNHITDVCEAISPLHNLTRLKLSNMGLTSLDYNCLKYKKALELIDLSMNRLINIDAVTGHVFPRLTILYVQFNQLENFGLGLENLEKLSELDISRNNFTNLKKPNFTKNPLLGKINIEGNFLDLGRNGIASLKGALDDLILLTDLNLAHNFLQNLEDLHPLTNLRRLNVSNNHITSLGPDIFRSLSGITHLDLSGNRITDVCEAITPLHNLTRLKLSNMGLTSLNYYCLKYNQDLELIDLSLNNLTHIGAVTGYHNFHLQWLKFLYVQRNHLQEVGPIGGNLNYLWNLLELDISFNRFINLKQNFTNNPLLGKINIEGNPWDCSDITYFEYLYSHQVELIGYPISNC